MSRYHNTLTLLNKLIAKLETNTGGEGLLAEDKVTALQGQNKALKNEDENQKKVDVQLIVNQEKKEPQKKKEKGGNKQLAKGQPEKPKLYEGVDPDILIFREADLRISELVEVWKHPQSTYLYCQKIMVGKELREIASGLQESIKIQDMKGKVVVFANLKPKPVGGFVSNGMVVCSSDKEHKNFELLRPEGPLGERLYLDGYEELFNAGEQILPIIKKKPFEKVLQHFATDNEGYIVWKGIKLRSKAGLLKSSILNGSVD